MSKVRRTKKKGYYPLKLPLTGAYAIDLRRFLDTPAGKHGYLKVEEGHFKFEDGNRARFWGANVGGAGCCPPHDFAEGVAELLASCGCNMLRFHAFERVLIDYKNYEDSQHFVDDAFDRMDYLIKQLKDRGIYTYMDLLDYRVFTKADGVVDADQLHVGGKLASIYNSRLIELQKKYATDLLTHRNPYTGLRWVDDPAIAVMEITNEHSFFWENYLDLPEYYLNELKRLWNQWLLKRYKDRKGLVDAWTDHMGRSALLPNEDPEDGTVELPNIILSWNGLGWENRAYVDPLTGPARCNDASIFCYELERKYYVAMRDHLRSIGVKVPITACVTNQIPPDLKAVADELDFISNGMYWDHPSIAIRVGDSKLYGQSFSNQSDLKAYTVRASPPWVAIGKVSGKPVIVREWNFPSPNKYRSVGLLEMAAYGLLNDWDGFCFFTAHGTEDGRITSFSGGSDPMTWPTFLIAALMFHRRDVALAKNLVQIGYSNVDTFYSWASYHSDPCMYTSYVSRTEKVFFEQEYDDRADVVVSSGASSHGDYSKAKRAILFASNPYADLYNKKVGREVLALKAQKALDFAVTRFRDLHLPFDKPFFLYDDFIFSQISLIQNVTPAIKLPSIPSGAKPFGVYDDSRVCVGYIDNNRLVAPHLTSIDEPIIPWWRVSLGNLGTARAFLDSLNYWKIIQINHDAIDGGCFESDTGELRRDIANGILTIDTPRTQAAMGFIGDRRLELGNMSVEALSPHCVISVSTLDDQPIGESSRLLLCAIGDAVNTGQDTRKRLLNWIVYNPGKGPALYKPADARINLKIGASAKNVEVYACDEIGRRTEAIPVEQKNGKMAFSTLTDRPVYYYDISIERS